MSLITAERSLFLNTYNSTDELHIKIITIFSQTLLDFAVQSFKFYFLFPGWNFMYKRANQGTRVPNMWVASPHSLRLHTKYIVVIVALPVTYRLVDLVPVNMRKRFKENSARTLLCLVRQFTLVHASSIGLWEQVQGGSLKVTWLH